MNFASSFVGCPSCVSCCYARFNYLLSIYWNLAFWKFHQSLFFLSKKNVLFIFFTRTRTTAPWKQVLPLGKNYRVFPANISGKVHCSDLVRAIYLFLVFFNFQKAVKKDCFLWFRFCWLCKGTSNFCIWN